MFLFSESYSLTKLPSWEEHTERHHRQTKEWLFRNVPTGFSTEGEQLLISERCFLAFTGKDDIFDLNWVGSVRQFLDKFSGIGWLLEIDWVMPRSLRTDECDQFFQEEGGEEEGRG